MSYQKRWGKNHTPKQKIHNQPEKKVYIKLRPKLIID